jgi:hypothetical protein
LIVSPPSRGADRDYPKEEAEMSDEREKRLESDEPELETDDVEGHMRFRNDAPDVRLEDEEDGDDVEAHQHLKPKADTP